MGVLTSHEAALTFERNRSVGHVRLEVAKAGGVSRRMRVREEGAFRVRFPQAESDGLQAVLVNTAGGMTGGDRLDLDVTVGTLSELTLTTAAAEKVYRSLKTETDVVIRLDVAPKARLIWIPQETIVFDRARFSRSIEIEMHGDASLLLAEALVLGRTAMGERVHNGRLADRWRVRRDGRLIFAESLRLDGGIASLLTQPAVTNGSVGIATALKLPGSQDDVEAARVLAERFQGEAGFSAWNGMAVARFCARDGAALRHDLMMVLPLWSGAALPRLWFN